MEKVTKSYFERQLSDKRSLFLGVRKNMCDDAWLSGFISEFERMNFKTISCRTAKAQNRGVAFSDNSYLALYNDKANGVVINTYQLKVGKFIVLCCERIEPTSSRYMYYLVEK